MLGGKVIDFHVFHCTFSRYAKGAALTSGLRVIFSWLSRVSKTKDSAGTNKGGPFLLENRYIQITHRLLFIGSIGNSTTSKISELPIYLSDTSA